MNTLKYTKNSTAFLKPVCKQFLFFRLAVALIFTVPSSFFYVNSVYAQKPVIIEYGWDYPDINKLSKRLDSMQHTPFDGICFSLKPLVIDAFDTVAQKESYFEYDKLASLKWGKYTNNYLLLFGFSKTGGNWFDDKAWQAIEHNMCGLSKAMLVGKLKGILFDAEYYYSNQFYDPWTYSEKQYPNLSFKEVQNKVRKRGSQFIQSLQKHTANFTFLSIWLTSLIVEDLKYGPIEKARHALLIPFMEGVLLGKKNTVKIVDGNEYAYWHYKPSQFLSSADYLKKNTIALMKTARAKKLATGVTIAQPIFYDGLIANQPDYEKGVPYLQRWKWLEENLKYSIATASSNIVWFYNQKIDWWQGKVNDTLNEIVTNSKTAFLAPQKNSQLSKQKFKLPTCENVNSGNGYYYYTDIKKPMETGDIAFTYTWDTNNKKLAIQYKSRLPDVAEIYQNHTLVSTTTPSIAGNVIWLPNFVKGSISILCKYQNNMEACGLLVN